MNMTSRVLLILSSLLLLSGTASAFYDDATFANINEIVTEHFELDIFIDFTRNVFSGTNTLSMRRTADFLDVVTLDVWDLNVSKIIDQNGRDYKFEIDDPNPNLGQRLIITIPEEVSELEVYNFTISYETSPTAEAISWLTPEQTSGKEIPYMFTQSESIFARSLAPFQDTPSIKTTYVVKTTTNPEFVTRVSGNMTYDYTDCTSRYSTFEMNIPVQSYLLAIASGNLVERRIGERTFVITEPEEIEKVENEFAQLEDFLIQAENITIPYEWGEYKLLILPPSFPFGGMENPLLTFASPAIVPGDKSSVDVAIHEIAHSWFGNLVTNNNWTNFWLNEGFTVFLERRAVRNIFGEDYMKVTAKLENQSMYYDMLDYGLDHTFSSLYPIFHGENPDDAFSEIPYEKGFQFLYYLETVIGEENFTEFLRKYLAKFSQESIGTVDFINYFTSFVTETFSENESRDILEEIDFDTWIYAPGLPPVTLDFETEEYNQSIELAQNFLDGTVDKEAALKLYLSFSVNLKGLFISHLIDNIEEVDEDKASYIDNTLHISSEINGEIIYRWLQVAIRSGQLGSPFTSAEEFVSSIGRQKFVMPVYMAMKDIDIAKAKEIFERHRDFYHPLTVTAIEKKLYNEIMISE
ncbi:unnamed protein product [Moneuplotes crassus]|uniref:Peptidase M1 leukotriene A4 hydrolase/aminopeptidase C-terminal domain-containing protein n=1 Tax=Euplotes crassus TaxID=5936 RepID=A0AAD1X702_EUPCR|nr:unnamed protein product [Moneuplotes crassus]